MTSISRVRVTGGFLDGLDLKLAPGLNVIVGPRGAGKTTLLELLRHALSLTGDVSGRGGMSFLRHALGAGEVIIDIKTSEGAERLVVDADGGGRRPELTSDSALMLGQNELEEIADSGTKRLALIDLRAGIFSSDHAEPVAELKRMTTRAHRLRSRREELGDLLRQKPTLLEDRNRLRERESELLARSANSLGMERDRLATLERELLQVHARIRGTAALRTAQSNIEDTIEPLGEVIDNLSPDNVDPEVAEALAEAIGGLQRGVQQVRAQTETIGRLATLSLERLRYEDVRLRGEAEPVRTSLEQAEQGLGVVTAELRDLESQIDRLNATEREALELQEQERRALAERNLAQDILENAAESLFERRDQAARDITEALEHRIKISVHHLADTKQFRSILVDLLQGSGLKYNALADAISSSVIPFALLRYIEEGDADGLSLASGIPQDRAIRIISTLNNEEGLSAIAASTLHDSVEFKLQDGAVLKTTQELSTGQKCAVTLPIVLTDTSRLVILDQPEDHLDNQFLVDRIITSLTARSDVGAQTIVATHNPNIPVLGSAVQVVNLASDGVRGAVQDEGPYDASQIVRVITTLMEGGRRAFDLRANFYATHRR